MGIWFRLASAKIIESTCECRLSFSCVSSSFCELGLSLFREVEVLDVEVDVLCALFLFDDDEVNECCALLVVKGSCSIFIFDDDDEVDVFCASLIRKGNSSIFIFADRCSSGI